MANALIFGRRIEYKAISYKSAKWPKRLDGYKVAFISDIHMVSCNVVSEIASRLNEEHIDLLLLGGDFSGYCAAGERDFSRGNNAESKQSHEQKHESSHGPCSELNRRAIEILSLVSAPDGIYGVEGNHDDYDSLFSAMQENGIMPLSNSGVRICEGFYLAGLEDYANRKPCVATAINGAENGDFVMLLSHHPDVTMEQDTKDVDFIFCGHTHGGQVSLFGLFAPYFALKKDVSAYGQRFVSGWASSRDGCSVYVSNGVGSHPGVPRVYARPQVILLLLNSV